MRVPGGDGQTDARHDDRRKSRRIPMTLQRVLRLSILQDISRANTDETDLPQRSSELRVWSGPDEASCV